MKRRVLVAEDDPVNRKLIRDLLALAGHEALEASDGSEAVRLAEEEQPDLILMDLQMPVMDGWQATVLLKKQPATKNIPIIILTASAMDSDRRRVMSLGPDGYLTKPIDTREFASTISAYFKEQNQE